VTPKKIEDMGGPYKDATVVENPETDMGSDLANLAFECTAQMTHTSDKAKVRFATTNVAAPTTASPSHKSQWGDGGGQLPTVNKTATGRYSIIYTASFPSITEPNTNNVETLSFFSALLQGWTTDAADKVKVRLLGISAHQLDLVVQSPEGTDADVGNSSGLAINVEAWIG
jgi:hypothetical protein